MLGTGSVTARFRDPGFLHHSSDGRALIGCFEPFDPFRRDVGRYDEAGDSCPLGWSIVSATCREHAAMFTREYRYVFR